MSLARLDMSQEVWLTCLTHALTTESEEIMGLLLGDVQHRSDGTAIAHVWGAAPQPRSDRQKDRVETNPEQLAAASALAERMTTATGITTRVIGWYHSHPHITVLPSHVDVRTQGMYQLLDPGFVGVIFSCFSEDAQKIGRVQVMAFQSLDSKQKQIVRVPTHVLGNVETEVLENKLAVDIIDVDSMDLKAKGGMPKVQNEDNLLSPSDSILDQADHLSSGRRDKSGSAASSPYQNDTIRVLDVDVEMMDSTSRIQEAVHRSNMDISCAEYVRKEIPLQVVPDQKINPAFDSYVDLQRVLFAEEQAAYNLSMTQSTRNGRVHPLAAIHHASTYQASMCKLIEHCLSPVISSLLDCIEENKLKLSILKDEEKSLMDYFHKENQSSHSPNRRHLIKSSALYAGASELKPSIDASLNRRSSSNMSPHQNPKR